MQDIVENCGKICLMHGCVYFKQDMQNKNLYVIAHSFLIHKLLKRCKNCQTILEIEMCRHHEMANCNDEQGIKYFS